MCVRERERDGEGEGELVTDAETSPRRLVQNLSSFLSKKKKKKRQKERKQQRSDDEHTLVSRSLRVR